MKKIIRVVSLLCLISIATNAIGQRVFSDAAYDFIRVQEELNNDFSFERASCHQFSNGNVLVDLYIRYEHSGLEEYQVPQHINGGLLTKVFPGGTAVVSDKYYKKSTHTYISNYMVFMDKYAKPIKGIKSMSGFISRYTSNHLWLFSYGSNNTVDGYSLTTYDKIICYSSDGKITEENSNLRLYSVADTPNYLYLVGEINTQSGSRSIVRIVNKLTNAFKERLGEYGEINYNLEFTAKGVSIDKHRNNGRPERYILPYEEEDIAFKESLATKGYDLTKSSDQVALAEHYLKGDVVDKNEKKAFELFEKAANLNDEKGLFKLAQCYQNGWGVVQNVSNAITYFEKCANMGNTDAMITLSDIYVEGKDISKNLSKALYWKERLGFLDNLDAQKFVIENSLTEYEHANITANDVLQIARKNKKNTNYPWAKFCYERAISLGNKDAAFELGEWLYEGTGIGKDNSRAIELLSSLGEEGNINAQTLLAKMYRDNIGMTADSQKAMYWIQKAAENGDIDSQVLLGAAYLNGNGVSKDKKLSAEWYEKAAMQNNQEAILLTVENYMNGNGVKKDIEKAINYITHLNHQSQLEFADRVFNGDGIKKNRKLAVSMYEHIAQNGDITAIKKLAYCYLDGTGVKKDINAAYQLAMRIRNTTHDGEDGDIYYIEGKYYESNMTFDYYGHPNELQRALECYERAKKCGNDEAPLAIYKLKTKYRIR